MTQSQIEKSNRIKADLEALMKEPSSQEGRQITLLEWIAMDLIDIKVMIDENMNE